MSCIGGAGALLLFGWVEHHGARWRVVARAMHNAHHTLMWAAAEMYWAEPRATVHANIAPLTGDKMEPPAKGCWVLRLERGGLEQEGCRSSW